MTPPFPPGWHGKLPTLGDFASRRLPPAFLDRWDDWLAAGINDLRAARPEAWLADYLDAPAWRFLLLPCVLDGGRASPDGAGWAGVLIPSVDRVGRYFPFTIAAPLARLPGDAAGLEALLTWLHRAEDLAQDALHDDWDIDALEAALAVLGVPAGTAGTGATDAVGAAAAAFSAGDARAASATAPLLLPAAGRSIVRPAPAARAELAGLIGASLVAAVLHSFSGWSLWHADPAGVESPPALMLTSGLPSGADFARLFTPLPLAAGGGSESRP